MLWQKFVFIITGYWLLERLSRLFPVCKQLKNQQLGLIDSSNRLLPAFNYLIKKKKKRSLKQCLWGGKAPFHWVMVLLLGLGMAPTFTHLEQYPVFMDVQDTVGIDWLMRITQQNIPATQAGVQKIPQFVWLDIDDETHRQWGEPLFTPRNRIQRLIDAAVKAEARLIIVDIDVSRQTPIEGLQSRYKDLKLHPYDEELANYLAEYPAYCQTHPHCPSIILARTFLNVQNDSSTPPPYYQPRLAFEKLEQAVANSKGYIQWASPRFHKSRDQVVRRHSHWKAICTDEQPGVIASIGVTATALLNSDTPKQAQDTINQGLVSLKPQNCTETYIQSKPPPENIEIGSLKLSTNPYSVRQRIVFSMPWLIRSEDTGKLELLNWLPNEIGFPIVTRLSALHFSETAETDVPVAHLEDHVKKGIVIIGGSYREGRDDHKTPLGSMPGALVIINATHSLLHYQQIEPLPNEVKWLIIATLILVMTMIFLCVASFWLAQMLNLLIIIGMMFISVILFRNAGLWLDFATPLIFVQLYQVAVFFALFILCALLSVWRGVQWLFNRLYSFVTRFKFSMIQK
ncbi:CHASE2 domain-containing protein [Candidatus Parabeggiatoa sp. HSG14]|uniref:CHASE2 domain-containing protein n=1 Tax=Candidatus Parabeggiatoa sp. HSG14 TaxID=3055593 RepID=UPI0025A7C19E|nr:CHASE2 domain-containing protein [Thiotrichales bacterium HSG14]